METPTAIHTQIKRQDSTGSVTKMFEKFIISNTVLGIGGYSKVSMTI